MKQIFLLMLSLSASVGQKNEKIARTDLGLLVIKFRKLLGHSAILYSFATGSIGIR